MYTTSLRKVGGSVMMAVPPAILDLLQVSSGSTVDMKVVKGRLMVEPVSKASYTLEELLAQCKFGAASSEEDTLWLEAPPVGNEII